MVVIMQKMEISHLLLLQKGKKEKRHKHKKNKKAKEGEDSSGPVQISKVKFHIREE